MDDPCAYVCPVCGRLFNVNCDCGYAPLKLGSIKNFSSKKTTWNQTSQESLSRLIESSLDTNTIVAELFGEKSYMYKYIFSENRALWKGLLHIKDDSIIVDIGCGWGAMAIELSNISKKVFACDGNIETLRFVEKRINERSIRNIELICIDNLICPSIPIRSNIADFVILSGVLEWVAKGSGQNPEAIQSKLLSETNRLLVDSGVLITIIENRFGFDYFCAHPDEHTFSDFSEQRLKYTTILPRFISNIIAARVKGRRYETYTHSYRRLIKMFMKAGFEYNRAFLVLPDYRFPEWILPIDGPFFENNRSAIESFSRKLNKNALMLFIASKNSFVWKALAVLYYLLLSATKKHHLSCHNFIVFSGKCNFEKDLNYEQCENLISRPKKQPAKSKS